MASDDDARDGLRIVLAAVAAVVLIVTYALLKWHWPGGIHG